MGCSTVRCWASPRWGPPTDSSPWRSPCNNAPAVTCRTLFVHASFLEIFPPPPPHDAGAAGGVPGSAAIDLREPGAGLLHHVPDDLLKSVLDTPLPEMAAEARRFLEFGRRIDAQKVVQCMTIVRRWTARSRRAPPPRSAPGEHSLDPDAFVTEEMEKPATSCLQLQLGYLFERHQGFSSWRSSAGGLEGEGRAQLRVCPPPRVLPGAERAGPPGAMPRFPGASATRRP